MFGGWRFPRRGRNRGQMIVIFAILLLVLLGFGALAIDVGYLYSMRQEMQRSADSGALAGASAFIDGGIWDNTDLGSPAMMKADERAREYATRETVGTAPLDNASITVSFPARDQVQVTVERPMELFFGKIYGLSTSIVVASATAMAEPVTQNLRCPEDTRDRLLPLAPLAFPYPYTGSGDGRYDPPGDKAYDLCIPSNRPNTLCQGGRVTFRVADTPSSHIQDYVVSHSGEIFPLVLCSNDNPGSESRLRDRIMNPCSRRCSNLDLIKPGYPATVKPQYSLNPTITALNNLSSADSFSWNPGLNLPSNPMSRRVMRVILYDPQDAITYRRIMVKGFVGFYIESVGSNSVTGYFVPTSAAGFTDIDFQFEPSLKTTRLVQ